MKIAFGEPRSYKDNKEILEGYAAKLRRINELSRKYNYINRRDKDRRRRYLDPTEQRLEFCLKHCRGKHKIRDLRSEIKGLREEYENYRREILGNNLPLIVTIAKRYSRNNNIEDLLQEGSLGLLKAFEKYDCRKKVSFATYAAYWIKQSIVRYITDNREESIIKVPYDIASALSRARNHEEHMTTIEDIRKIAKTNRKNAERIMSGMMTSYTPSLDMELNEDGSSLLMLIGKLDETEWNEKDSILKECIKNLNQKEQQIINYRYNTFDHYTFVEVGKKLGISKQRAQQIEAKALKKLKTCYYYYKFKRHDKS
jgi:RNA polymerase primary sigma factor